MGTPYTGNESNVPASRADTSVTIPVDGDPGNAATFNVAFQKLADYLQRLVKKAGFLDLASTWTALQTFSAGASFNTINVTGAATAASFAYAPAQTAYSYVDASQFVTNSSAVFEVFPSFTRIASASSSSGGTANGRIRAPRGATIISLELLASNEANLATHSFDSVSFRRIVTSGSTVAIERLESGDGSGQIINVPASPVSGTEPTRPPAWFTVSLIGVPGVVPSNGFLHLHLNFPSGTTELKLWGARIGYTFSAVSMD